MQELVKEMVELYGDRIYRLALRYTADHHHAQDITQETFLRACKNISRFDRSKEPGPWLFKIACNLCRNWIRDRKDIPVEIDENYLETVEPGPEQVFLIKERGKELYDALVDMPLIYREVLLLKHVSDLSYDEISKTLNINLSLVKNRLYRGRLMLSEILQKEVGSDEYVSG